MKRRHLTIREHWLHLLRLKRLGAWGKEEKRTFREVRSREFARRVVALGPAGKLGRRCNEFLETVKLW